MCAGRRTQVVKGAVCKTAMQRFDPARRLQTEFARAAGLFFVDRNQGQRIKPSSFPILPIRYQLSLEIGVGLHRSCDCLTPSLASQIIAEKINDGI